MAVDISSPGFDAVPYQIPIADFMHQLHAIDQDGQVFTGVDSFWAIWQAFPTSTIFGLMGRIIQLPVVNKLARIGYWLFARIRPYLPKRHQCESGTCRIHQKEVNNRNVCSGREHFLLLQKFCFSPGSSRTDYAGHKASLIVVPGHGPYQVS